MDIKINGEQDIFFHAINNVVKDNLKSFVQTIDVKKDTSDVFFNIVPLNFCVYWPNPSYCNSQNVYQSAYITDDYYSTYDIVPIQSNQDYLICETMFKRYVNCIIMINHILLQNDCRITTSKGNNGQYRNLVVTQIEGNILLSAPKPVGCVDVDGFLVG